MNLRNALHLDSPEASSDPMGSGGQAYAEMLGSKAWLWIKSMSSLLRSSTASHGAFRLKTGPLNGRRPHIRFFFHCPLSRCPRRQPAWIGSSHDCQHCCLFVVSVPVFHVSIGSANPGSQPPVFLLASEALILAPSPSLEAQGFRRTDRCNRFWAHRKKV